MKYILNSRLFYFATAVISITVDFNAQGIELYDPTEDLCCNGTIHRSRKNFATRCCGKAIYNIDTEMCCDGEPFKKPKPNDLYGCCNRKSYRIDKQHCCNGKIENLPKGGVLGNWECCGGKAYIVTKQICCQNEIHDTNGSPLYCCGSETYNEYEKLCCTFYMGDQTQSTKLVDKLKDNTACCGDGQIYNVDEQICCNNTVHDFLFTGQCCGDKYRNYNDRTKKCCEDRLVEGLDPNADNTCCGSVGYDPGRQECCEYDKVITKKTQNTKCCKGEIFESETPSVCCGKQNIPLMNGAKGDCCFTFVNEFHK